MEQTIKLPAIVGDGIFVIRHYHDPRSYYLRVTKAVITEIGCDKRGWYIITQDVGRYGGTRSDLNSFGVSWFLTEAEAKEELSKLKFMQWLKQEGKSKVGSVEKNALFEEFKKYNL